MTPANPDALAEALARELARLDGWQDPDALWTDNIGIIDRGGEGSPVYLDYVEDAGKLIAGPLAPILADLQRVTAERDEAQADQKAAEDSNDALNEKLHALAPHGSCACSYDKPGDVCLHHSPALAAAEARAAQLQAERDEAVNKANEEETSAVWDKAMRRIAENESARLRDRAAQLQAEAEALKEDAARLDFLDGCNARLNASYGTHYGWKLVLNHNVNRLVLGDMKVDLHDSEGGNNKLPSCRLAIDDARKRTALAARAATAREGA